MPFLATFSGKFYHRKLEFDEVTGKIAIIQSKDLLQILILEKVLIVEIKDKMFYSQP